VVSIKFLLRKNDEDLTNIYQVIRELYVNQLLAYYNNRPVKCSELGHLYYADDGSYNLDKQGRPLKVLAKLGSPGRNWRLILEEFFRTTFY